MANLLVMISVLIMISSINNVAAFSRGDIDIGDDHLLLIYRDDPWTWPAVACHSGFEASAGEAACLQMGFTGLKQIQKLPIGNTPDHPVYQSIKCPAVSNYRVNGERNILRCQFGANITKEALSVANCPDLYLVAIYCNNDRLADSPYDGQVFLSKNVENEVLTKSEGFLSIYVSEKINHQYVCCNDQFKKKQYILADSACRQLGYINASDVRCTTNNIVDKTGLSITNYTCEKFSIPCFSNCFEQDNWKITDCQDDHGHVHITCAYNESQADLLISGRESMCKYSNAPNCTCVSDDTGYIVAIVMVALVVLALIIVIIIIRIKYLNCRKNRPRCCRNGNNEELQQLEGHQENRSC